MLVDLLEFRVVPTAPETISGLFVGGVGHPLREDLARLRLGEVDEDLLPVSFAVVGSEKIAPPVIEWVEQPVLQDDPAGLPNHATMVLVVLLFLHKAAVHDARSLHAFPRHPTSEQQSQREERVRQARDVAHACEPASTGAEGLLGPIEASSGAS